MGVLKLVPPRHRRAFEARGRFAVTDSRPLRGDRLGFVFLARVSSTFVSDTSVPAPTRTDTSRIGLLRESDWAETKYKV